jgi:flavin reductase (DIM6/NTAB) family NADH-FMN oxidoreductase RutF
MTAAAAGIAPEQFRRVLGTVATPVSVVTTIESRRPHGTTVSAFCSLSLKPPLVLVALDHGSELLRLVCATRRFAVNLLAVGQDDLARRFARKGSGKFDGVDWQERSGLPRLPGSHGFLACELEQLVAGGDHTIVTGLVTDADCTPATPLVYCERTFWRLAT